AFYSSFEGLLAWHDGQLFITVEFESVNGGTACKDLIVAIENTLGVQILEADLDLVDIPEIASRAQRSRQSIQLLVTGKRRGVSRPSFPAPMAVLAGRRIWDWGTVLPWVSEEGMVGHQEPSRLTREELYALNTWLYRRSRLSASQHLNVDFVEVISGLAPQVYDVPTMISGVSGLYGKTPGRPGPYVFTAL